MRKLIYQGTTLVIGLSLFGGVAYACTSYINHNCDKHHSKVCQPITSTPPKGGSNTTGASTTPKGTSNTSGNSTIPGASKTTVPTPTPAVTPESTSNTSGSGTTNTFNGDSSSTS